MKRLFWPAEALMNRLNYPLKFGVVGLLVLMAFAALMLTITEQFTATINRSQSELIALDLSRPLSTVVELTQQHRGLSARVLGGDDGVVEQRRTREKEVDAALETLTAALDDYLLGQHQWQSLKTAWLTIKREGSGWSRERNYEAHTTLIDNLLRFQTLFVDAYGLTFDPEPETYYLMTVAVNRLPYLLERLGRLRALGSGVLAQRQIE